MMLDKIKSFDDYEAYARLTALYPEDIGLAYTALGLAGEAGEVANKVKKIYRDADGDITDVMQEKLADELGDVLWYLAMTATEIDVPLEIIARRNARKLWDRYERGTIKGDGDSR